MPYATIDEILSRVDRRSPCPPGQFPDFDPEDLKAWAYFIYVYLDCSQADLRTWPSLEPARRGWPSFLPKYDASTGRIGDVPPPESLDAAHRPTVPFEKLRKILDYISYCMEVWREEPQTYQYPTRILGFLFDDYDEYDYCFQRAKDARDVAWEKAMDYSARALYPYADPNERPGGPNVVASGESGTDVAYILPDIASLFLEVNEEWNRTFNRSIHGLEIQSGYRTQNWHEQVGTVRQSAHVAGAAIDVLPKQRLINVLGLNVCIAYLCWLFKRVAWKSPNFRRVTLTDGQKVDVVPYTIFENNQTCHVSYAWLLCAAVNRNVRKDVLPNIVRPYNGDVPSNRNEFGGPGRLHPLWGVSHRDRRDFRSLSPSGGVTAGWLAEYISSNLNALGGLVTDLDVASLGNQDARLGGGA